MPMPKMQVDGAQIRADRKKAGLSRQGLAQIAKMSLSTMRRIEAGQGSEANIVNLASILKTNPDKYITKEAIPNVSGRWIALYFEQEPTFPPYIVEELLELSQYSRKISGTYVTTHSDHPQGLIETRSYVIDGFVEDEFVMGKYQRKEDDPL